MTLGLPSLPLSSLESPGLGRLSVRIDATPLAWYNTRPLGFHLPRCCVRRIYLYHLVLCVFCREQFLYHLVLCVFFREQFSYRLVLWVLFRKQFSYRLVLCALFREQFSTPPHGFTSQDEVSIPGIVSNKVNFLFLFFMYSIESTYFRDN